MRRKNSLLNGYRKKEKGGPMTSFSEKTAGGIGAGAMLADGALDLISPTDRFGTRSGAGAAASGALKGAAAGAQFGVVGMGVGALVGGATSFLGNKKAQAAKQTSLTESSDADAKTRDEQVTNRVAGNPDLQYGSTLAARYKYGGTLKGAPSNKFRIGKSIPGAVSQAPDLLPDVSIRPTAFMKRALGGPMESNDPPVKNPSAVQFEAEKDHYNNTFTTDTQKWKLQKPEGDFTEWHESGKNGYDNTYTARGQKLQDIVNRTGKRPPNSSADALDPEAFGVGNTASGLTAMTPARVQGFKDASRTVTSTFNNSPYHTKAILKGVAKGTFSAQDTVGMSHVDRKTFEDAEYSKQLEDYRKTSKTKRMAMGGSINPTSSNTAEVEGPSHANGGVKLPSKGVELEGEETIGSDDFVFSKELGIADLHKKTGKAMGKNERRPQGALQNATAKALVRQEGFLKIYQEQIKKSKGIENEIDGTAGQMKEANATEDVVMKMGGSMKKMLYGGDQEDPNKGRKYMQTVNGKVYLDELNPVGKITSDPASFRANKTARYRNTDLDVASGKITQGEAVRLKAGLKAEMAKFERDKMADYKKSTASIPLAKKEVLTGREYKVPFGWQTSAEQAGFLGAPKNKEEYRSFTDRRSNTPNSTPVFPNQKPYLPLGDMDIAKPGKPLGEMDIAKPKAKQPIRGAVKTPQSPAALRMPGNDIDVQSKEAVDLTGLNAVRDAAILANKPQSTIPKEGLPTKVPGSGEETESTSKFGDAMNSLVPFASNIANSFRRLPAPPRPRLDDEITPDLVNFDADRAESTRQRRGADASAKAGIGSNNTVAAIKAANLAQDVRAVNNINQAESNTNVGIKNQAQQFNSAVRKGNNLKEDYYNQQNVERQVKQQSLDSENLADVGNKMQEISKDKKLMQLNDDKLLLEASKDDTGRSLRLADAVLKRNLSPKAYKDVTVLREKMEQANEEDRKVYREQLQRVMDAAKTDTKTVLASSVAQKNADNSAKTQAATEKIILSNQHKKGNN